MKLAVSGDDSYAHRCVAAYISDHFFLGTALIPFPRFKTEMGASLDHSMWFHSLFRIDEWMLYECESPRLGTVMSYFDIVGFL